MDFFSHTYDEKLQNIKNPVLSFSFYKYISLSVALLLHLRIYIIGILIKKTRQFDFYGPGAMAPAPKIFGLSSQIRFLRHGPLQ